MASLLPEELVQEILVRLPPDEPVHLTRASLVCKSWYRVLSDQDCFVRRCRGFHGAPPLLGYIQNRYYGHDAMQFVPTSTKSPVRMPAVDYSCWIAVDCRHGRVLIHFQDMSKRRLIVWDPITGSQQHLSVPSANYPSYSSWRYTGAVLCAKDGCDHFDCQAGDPFRVVFVQNNLHSPIFACATNYSSLTGVWSAPVPCQSNHNYTYNRFSGKCKHNLLIGDVLYFAFEDSTSILKYNLCTHLLSEINVPRAGYRPFLMKAEDGKLGLAALSKNRIHIWSRQDVTPNGVGEWIEHKVLELETLLPRFRPDKSYEVVGIVEGTNTIFINISTGIFTLDIKSKKVKKIGEREGDRLFDPILPYVRFCTPRSSIRVNCHRHDDANDPSIHDPAAAGWLSKNRIVSYGRSICSVFSCGSRKESVLL